MQISPLQSRKIGFHQVEPRGIGGRPIDMDASADSCRQFSQCLLVRAEVVHNQVDPTFRAGRQHMFEPESPTAFGRFRGKAFSDGYAGAWTESAKPLQCSVTFVTIRAQVGTPAPSFASSGDCL